MTDCITHFFPKGITAPRTGTIPPMRERPELHPVPDLDAQIWGIVGKNGNLSAAKNIISSVRQRRGTYQISFLGRLKNDDYIVSAYGDERPNYRRRGEWFVASARTREHFVIQWRDGGTLVDTDFSVAIY